MVLYILVAAIVYVICYAALKQEKKWHEEHGIVFPQMLVAVDLLLFLTLAEFPMLPIVYLALNDTGGMRWEIFVNSGFVMACGLFFIGNIVKGIYSFLRRRIFHEKYFRDFEKEMTFVFLIVCVVYVITLVKLGALKAAFTFISIAIGKFVWFDSTPGSIIKDFQDKYAQITCCPLGSICAFISIAVTVLFEDSNVACASFLGVIIAFLLFAFLHVENRIKPWCTRIWFRIKKAVEKMNKTKVKIFFAKYGNWICTTLSIALFTIVIFVCNKFGIIDQVRNWSGEIIAVVGTLLGALIGGVFTLMGSVYVNKKQLKAQNYIKRKNLIYKPLYDELCTIENDVLSENPFPRIIVFKPQDFGNLKYPQYTVWDRIKSDTRYLETPKNLISEMERLYSKIGEYLETRTGKNEEITDLTNGIFQEVIGTQSSIGNLGDCVIDYALEDTQDDICKYCNYGLIDNVDVTEEQRSKINQLFYERCRENASIQKIKKAKQEWDVQQKKVIDLLTDLIQYVNVKYEG